MRFARACEVIMGMVFIVGAAMKATDIPGFAVAIRQYQVFFDSGMLRIVAIATVSLETILGIALIVGWRIKGITHVVSIAMLVFFSGMIAYAWAFYGLKDCGCFGGFIEMGPGPSILKNVVMIGLLAVPWVASRRSKESLPWTFGDRTIRVAVASVALVCVAGAAGYGSAKTSPAVTPPENTVSENPSEPAGPFAQLVIRTQEGDLALNKGTYLVAVMSSTCEHCMASVPKLNDLMASPTSPTIVGVMLGDEAELDQFRTTTTPMFPTQLVDDMTWIDLLGTAMEPPRFVLVQDGVALHHWDADVPSADAVAAALEGTS